MHLCVTWQRLMCEAHIDRGEGGLFRWATRDSRGPGRAGSLVEAGGMPGRDVDLTWALLPLLALAQSHGFTTFAPTLSVEAVTRLQQPQLITLTM